MDPRSVITALTEIAEAASETLELQEVFNRVAMAVYRLIPFDNIDVVRVIGGHSAVVHATTAECKINERACSGPVSLSEWSPRIRPRPGPIARLDDAEAELDPGFMIDSRILEAGVRSALWAPFRPSEPFTGGVVLSARRPHAFTDEHQEMIEPIAALLGSGVEHWRIWDAERRRRERLDRLETVLGTLAESLDIREVFERLRSAVQVVLPHDLLVLTEHDARARTFRLIARAGESDIEEVHGPVELSEAESERSALEYEICDDMHSGLKPDTERNRLLLATGMRSWLRVPVRLAGEVRGVCGFLHREPSRFSVDDIEVARRIADRIALVLSHRELARKARIADEAKDRAARLEATVAALTRELEAHGRGRVIGVSSSWKDVMRHIGRVASSETTVLITGESGTGKEVVSRLIHQGSARSARPFVAINCAALPEQLLESELFGHEKGAFTGAVATKIGRIEQAAGGTLFLDEITEMSPVVQAKFLRLLQERDFQRLGGTRAIKADVRVIAATNRDLTTAMSRGQFRDDLYYRLNVYAIHIRPLRERPEDIMPLAEAFLEELGGAMGRPSAGISRDAQQWLLAHPWPGNVRELRNAIERAILLCDGGLITHEHLPHAIAPDSARPEPGAETEPRNAQPPPRAGGQLGSLERELVARALREARGNKTRAARQLGLTRSQLYTRLQKYGVD